MRLASTNKAFRWLMAASVSMWMAGAGCLFACSNGEVISSTQTSAATAQSEVVVAGGSCASMRSHDCCATRKTEAQKTRSESALPSLASLPRGMMEDCPFTAHTTAEVSKAGSDMSDVGLVRETCTSQVLTSKSLTNSEIVSLVPSNRGPTYLRCCVFLI